MAKIINDKYYTPTDLANYCWDKTMEIIGEENVSEIIEPSCGNGAFYRHSKYEPHFGYDIEPEFEGKNVIKGDFLKQDIKYLYGRLCISNPPFGTKNNLARAFYNKCVEIGDYIAFILPISQLNNTQSLYKFDLLHSEDLGKRWYSDREIHCCFNVYRRPKFDLHKKPTTKVKDIKIYRQDCQGYASKDSDVRMCYFGDGCAGKILQEGENYSGEYKIKILNDDLRGEIVDYIKIYDWKSIKGVAMRRIKQYQVLEVLCNKFPQLINGGKLERNISND